jgi:hypothetical protein
LSAFFNDNKRKNIYIYIIIILCAIIKHLIMYFMSYDIYTISKFDVAIWLGCYKLIIIITFSWLNLHEVNKSWYFLYIVNRAIYLAVCVCEAALHKILDWEKERERERKVVQVVHLLSLSLSISFSSTSSTKYCAPFTKKIYVHFDYLLLNFTNKHTLESV